MRSAPCSDLTSISSSRAKRAPLIGSPSRRTAGSDLLSWAHYSGHAPLQWSAVPAPVIRPQGCSGLPTRRQWTDLVWSLGEVPATCRICSSPAWPLLGTLASRTDCLKAGSPIHRNTSSARISRVCGTSIPSWRATRRSMISSYLVSCSTGKSAGVAPFRILSTYPATRRIICFKLGP